MIPYKVYVSCKTYNQSKYIIDTMNGFCIQKTRFPFICAIFDDASTDGEQQVIRKYIDDNFDLFEESDLYKTETDYAYITYARHKINTNCHFVVFYLKNNHYSNPQKYAGKKEEYVRYWMRDCKYEAICEGDDYWTDEYKLQKQVDILDKDECVSMVFHRAKILMEFFANPALKCFSTENREYSATELFDSWIVPTASIVFRISSLNFPIKNESKILNSDIFLVEKCAHMGKVVGMSNFMSVYRMQSAGVTYDTDLNNPRIMKYPDHFECIAENFPKIDRHAINIRLMNSYWNRAICQKDFRSKLNDYYNGIKSVGLVYAIKPFLRLLKGRIKCFLRIR